MRTSSSFLEVARVLAQQAAERLMELRNTTLVHQRKADHSLVTNADHDADRIIREGLRRAFPDHAILTEESGLDGSPGAEYMWVVDPLDGTKAYANGISGFSVMIGLLKAGKPLAGVVVDPMENYVYEAMKGQGCYILHDANRVSAHVSSRDDFSAMPVITSTGFPQKVEKNLQAQFTGPWIPALNSVGVKVGYVVRQSADIYINHHGVHYWDTCGPQIILEEAGGLMTFLDGSPLHYALEEGSYRHMGPTLASNSVRHQEILSLLRLVKPPLL